MSKVKKIIPMLIITLMMVFASAALPVSADEDESNYTGEAGYTDNTGDTVPEPIAAQDTQPQQPQSQPVQAGASSDSAPARSGVSFATVFLMFILGIIINAVISFIIANRFYKMSKKDTHLQAEIRALRRDIDEKFIGNVKEIKEKASTISNTNKNYSRGGGITYREEPPKGSPEVAKRWNIDVNEEAEPDVKITPAGRTSSSGRAGSSGRGAGRQTTRTSERSDARRSARKQPENIDADEDVSDSVKDKAKKFLGDIFPFNED